MVQMETEKESKERLRKGKQLTRCWIEEVRRRTRRENEKGRVEYAKRTKKENHRVKRARDLQVNEGEKRRNEKE